MSPVKCLRPVDLALIENVHVAASAGSPDVVTETATALREAGVFLTVKFVEMAAAGCCRICLQVMLLEPLCEGCLTSECSLHGAPLGIVCAQICEKSVQKHAETRVTRIQTRRATDRRRHRILSRFRTLHSRRSTGAGENTWQRRREGNDAPPASTFAGSARRSKSPSFSNMER